MNQFYEQIEAYLLGELTEETRRDFETALQSDQALARSVEQHRVMLQRLESARIRQKVKKSILETKSESGAFTVSKNVLWAVAASLTILAAMVWFFTQSTSPDTPQIAVEQPAPVQTPTIQPEQPKPDTTQTPPTNQAPQDNRRLMAMAKEYHRLMPSTMVRDAVGQSPNTPKSTVQLAADAYLQQNYRQVAALLRPDSLVKTNEYARLMRADARFQLGQFATSLADYTQLSDSFEFKHDARWNALLCQLALGQSEQAAKVLKSMTQDPDFPFYKKALELQARL